MSGFDRLCREAMIRWLVATLDDFVFSNKPTKGLNETAYHTGSYEMEIALWTYLQDIKRLMPNEGRGIILELGKSYQRREDMSPDGTLRLLVEEDGDIIVSIAPSSQQRRGFAPSVQFCTIGSGGGKSPYTLAALRELMHAIRKDNEENPV